MPQMKYSFPVNLELDKNKLKLVMSLYLRVFLIKREKIGLAIIPTIIAKRIVYEVVCPGSSYLKLLRI